MRLFFPPRCVFCDAVLGRKEEGLCPACRKQYRDLRPVLRPLAEGMAVFLYAGVIRDAIRRFKYRGRAEYASFFAECICSAGRERIRAFCPDALVPVPIHASRLRERGFNQAEELARQLARRTGIPCRSDLVIRTRKTKPQNKLTPEERRKNVKGAFARRRAKGIPSRILLVDDIYTTGSTVRELQACLLAAGASAVQVLCIAEAAEHEA